MRVCAISRAPSRSSTIPRSPSIIVTAKFQFVALDIFESGSDVLSYQGNRYTVLITELMTHYRWIYHMKKKKKKKDFLLKCLRIFQHDEVEPRRAKIRIFISDGELLYWTPEVKASLDGSFVLLMAPYRSELNPAEPSFNVGGSLQLLHRLHQHQTLLQLTRWQVPVRTPQWFPT